MANFLNIMQNRDYNLSSLKASAARHHEMICVWESGKIVNWNVCKEINIRIACSLLFTKV